MFQIKSTSSDKGEDQVNWNSWCASKVKKTAGFSAIYTTSAVLTLQNFTSVPFIPLSNLLYTSGGCLGIISILT